MLRRFIGLLAVAVFAQTNETARAVIINTSTVIDANNSFPGETVEVVDGANPPTVVDVVEGAVIGGWMTNPDIIARGQSIVRLWDGGILEHDLDAVVTLHDQSRVQVFGEYGYWQELGIILHDSSRLDLVAGSSIGYAVAEGTAHIHVRDGQINSVRTDDHASARLINADGVLGLENVDVTAGGNSEIKIRGSALDKIQAEDDSAIWLAGGGSLPYASDRAQFHWVDGIRFREPFNVSDDATLHVYGYDMEYTFYDNGEPPAVHGYRKDGTFFYNPVILRDNARIVFHTVPEPTSASMFALGALTIAASWRLFASR